MTLTMRYAARSDRGLIRHGNQDSVYAGPRLLAVADGMGGMAAGDVASNIVIAALAHLDEDVPGNAPVDALKLAVESANQQIRDAVDQNPAMEGMGTTLTGLLFGGSKIGLVHIGDSRAYLLREGEFVQVTRDDTYVQLLVDEGRITAEEANTHPQKSLLMRALDGRDADPEYSVRQAVPGDRYLLCSDGLSGVVSDETIAATLREYSDPNQCAERLIQLALRGGGPDNITVIVADVTAEDILEEAPVVGGAAATDRGMTSSADSSTTAVVLVLLLALLATGLWGGWTYTQSKYYVGVTDDGTVAIFQGIPGTIAGFSLFTVDFLSGTSIDDLTPAARDKVREGIGASSRDEARTQLESLLDPQSMNLLPVCPEATAPPTVSALAPQTPSSSALQPTGPPDCRPAVR
jgi:serine/threonine protein phosphatase PrpC